MRWKIKKTDGKVTGMEIEGGAAIQEEVKYIGRIIGSIVVLGKMGKIDQKVADLLIDVVKEVHLRGMRIGIRMGKGEVE